MSILYERPMKNIGDKWGVGLSSLCLLHCLAMSLLPIVLPSLQFLYEDLYFHGLMGLMVLFFSLISFSPTYIRSGFHYLHLLALIGLGLLALGFSMEYSHQHEGAHLMSITGSVLMTIAHLINWKQTPTNKNTR